MHQNKKDFIQRVLFSHYLMTYNDIGQPTRNDLIDFNKNLWKAERNTEKTLAIIQSDKKFEIEHRYFSVIKKYSQKRAWCSLRDFFKSPEFNGYFRNALSENGFYEEDFLQLFAFESLQQFELPEDVWNNNSRFRDFILEGTDYQKSKQPLNKILRHYYDKNKNELSGCYPEQFDITFDFVPRMCAMNNCDICPIGFLKQKKLANFHKTCVKNSTLYCSAAMINCNYKIECVGDDCKLLSII
jgi:hypothetical protein